MPITVSTQIAAPLADVWRAYVTPADIMQWNHASDDWHTTAATVDLRVGGIFSSRMEAKDGSFGFDFSGEYTEVVPHALLAYRFGDRMARIAFTEDAAGVTVHEANLESAQDTFVGFPWGLRLRDVMERAQTLDDAQAPAPRTHALTHAPSHQPPPFLA